MSLFPKKVEYPFKSFIVICQQDSKKHLHLLYPMFRSVWVIMQIG